MDRFIEATDNKLGVVSFGFGTEVAVAADGVRDLKFVVG